MEEAQLFAARWGLDEATAELVAGLPAEAQARVFADFRPAEDTRDVNARLRSFVKSVMNRSEMMSQQPSFGLGDEELFAFIQKWGLQQDSIAQLGELPPEILVRVLREFRPNSETMNMSGRLRAFIKSVSSTFHNSDVILQFSLKWSLDEDSVQFLRSLPPEILQRVMDGFHPNADTTNIGGRLRAFAKAMLHPNSRRGGAGGLGAPGGAPGFAGARALGAPGAEGLLQDLRQEELLAAERLAAEWQSELQAPQGELAGPELAAGLPVGLQPQGEPPATLLEFLQRWGLGPDAQAFLEGLPPETLRVVLADFRPAPDTKNILGRLMAFARNIGKPRTTGTQADVISVFALQWGLEAETVRFLEGLPQEVLLRVVRDFTPNDATKNLSGRLKAFARSVMQQNGPPQASYAQAQAQAVDPLQQFAGAWGLDQQTIQFLRGLQQDVLQTVLQEFTPTGDTMNLPGRLRAFARSVAARAQQQPQALQAQLQAQASPSAPALADFVGHWQLGDSSVALLQTLPEETLRVVMTDFHPAGDTVNVDGRLQGFIRAVLTAPKRPAVAGGPLILPPGKRLRA